MKNRYSGECNLCGKTVGVKQGRFRASPKHTQCFTGLRCMDCSWTSKNGLKKIRERGLLEKHQAQLFNVRHDLLKKRN